MFQPVHNCVFPRSSAPFLSPGQGENIRLPWDSPGLGKQALRAATALKVNEGVSGGWGPIRPLWTALADASQIELQNSSMKVQINAACRYELSLYTSLSLLFSVNSSNKRTSGRQQFLWFLLKTTSDTHNSVLRRFTQVLTVLPTKHHVQL